MSLWRILWSCKWRVALTMFCFMLLGFVMTGAGERTYTAESLLILEDNSASLSTALTRDDSVYANPTTAVEVFGSRPVIEEVVERLALDQDPEFNPFLPGAQVEPSPIAKLMDAIWTRLFGPRKDEAPVTELPAGYMQQEVVARVQDSLRFLVMPQTSLIHVQATTFDPDKSAQLANAVAEAFLNDALRSRLDSVDRVVAQLGDRLVNLRQDFREKEQALQAFKNETEIVDPAALRWMAAEVTRLRDRREMLAQDLEVAMALESDVKALDSLGAEARAARIAQTPELQALRAAVGPATGSMLAEARMRRQRVEEQSAKLSASITALEDRVALHSERLLHFGQLEREMEASGEIYEFSQRRLNELSVQADVETGGGRIVFSAHPPQTGNSRGRLRTMLILGFLGLIVSVTWILIQEANNQTLRSAADLKALLPKTRIVALPRVPVKGLPWKRQVDLGQLLTTRPTEFSKGIRRLRTTLLTGAAEKPIAVHVASDLVGPGKSLVTLALARSLSFVDKKVLIIIADERSAAVMRLLQGSPVQNGLENVLIGGEDLDSTIIRQQQLGVDLLVNTQDSRTPADLLELDSFPLLLQAALERYDIVLIDTAPLLAAPDGLQVARHVDKTLFVAGCNLSSSGSLETSLGDLLPKGPGAQDVVVFYGAEADPQQKAERYSQKLGVM